MYKTVIVHQFQRGLEYVWGRFVRELPPGRYRFWSWSGRGIIPVDMRETGLQVPGQEVLTADRAAVRVNVLVRYRVVDPVNAMHEVASYTEALYQVAQLAAREAVAGRELEALLCDRTTLSPQLTATVAEQALPFGVEVRLVALKDLMPAPALQMAYQAKLTADQQGQAKLIEARHAVAVARAQANAASILAENPATLMQRQLDVLATAAGSMGNHFIVMPESLADIARKLAG